MRRPSSISKDILEDWENKLSDIYKIHEIQYVVLYVDYLYKYSIILYLINVNRFLEIF